MKKRVISLLLALVLALGLLPTAAFAAEAEEISTAKEFADMKQAGNYILTKDITVSTPYANDFSGTFDGNGHTITLRISSTSYNTGLFSKIGQNGTVKNVITAGSVTGKSVTGAVAGLNYGTIQKCWNQANVTGTTNVGGIVGTNGSSSSSNLIHATVTGCYNTGSVKGTRYIGGIVGNSANSTLEKCASTGTIDTTNALRGGITGNSAASRDTITDCYWLNTSCEGGKEIGTSFKSTELKTVAGKLGSSWTTEKGTLVLKFGSTEPSVSVTASPASLQMVNGSSQPTSTLTVKTENINMDGAAVEWSTEQTDIISLNDGGDDLHEIAQALQPGTAAVTVTVTPKNGTPVTGSADITVLPCFTTVEIRNEKGDMTLIAGQKAQAVVSVNQGGSYDPAEDEWLTYRWYWYPAGGFENKQEIKGETGRVCEIPSEFSGQTGMLYLYVEVYLNGSPAKKSSGESLTGYGSFYYDLDALVNEDKAALTRAVLGAEGNDIRSALTLDLPTVGLVNQSTITWKCEPSGVIDTATGQVTLPESGKVQVTITATFRLKGVKEPPSKPFTYTVWSQAAVDAEAGDKLLALSNDVDAAKLSTLVPVCGTDTNVLTMVKNKLGCGDIAVSITKVVRNGAEDEASGIAANGDISYFYADPNQTADERLQWFGSYTVTFSFVRGDAAVTREVPVTVYWDVEKVERVMRDEILSQVDIDTSEPVTEDFELPRIADGKKWTLISWESSDPSITVSKRNQDSADTLFDPYVAVVRGGLTEKEVTLTAVFTFQRTNDVTGSEEPIRLYRTFTVKVAPSEAVQKYQSALDAVFGEGSLTDAATGAALNLGAVKNDIQFPTTRDLGAYMMEQYREGFDGKYTPLVITSSAPAVIAEPDVANAARVAVYRPAVGQGEETVTLTVKILDRPSGEGRNYASMPVLAEKTFRIVVKPLTREEINAEKELMAEVKAHYWDGIKNGNDAAGDVTGDLAPFVEVYKQDGALVWVRDVREMRNSGIVPVAMNDWQELEAWRLFRSSNPAAVTHENLLVTQQFEGKAVTVTSALSSETLGRYGELYRKDRVKYAAYAACDGLYYQPVSAELVVRGRNTAHMVKKMITVNDGTETRLVSEAVEEKVTVSFTLSGNGELWLGTRTLRDLDEGVTVFDVLRQLRKGGVLSFEHKGGYVQSITCNGKTLAELDEGKNSGWLYTVNGELPDVYMSAYGLKNGDSVRVYFTKDYTKEPGADRWKPVTPVTKTETVTNADGSVTKIETKSDGTVIETTTWRDGSTLTAETSPNGRVETVEKRADGTTVETVESASGEITASVSVPKSVGSTRVDIPVSKPTSSMVAVIVHPDGTEEIVKGSIVTETGIALRAEGDMRLKIIDNAKRFNDMADHWAKDAVEFASSRELFNGVGNDAFGPDLSMTRGMVSTVLARLAGADTAGGETWYAKGTVWAVENGISDGTAPEQPVTREQLAAMLYRYAGSPAVSGELGFDDADSISAWARDAVRWCVDNGILNGVGGNRMTPQDLARRGQVAAMLMRFLQATV